MEKNQNELLTLYIAAILLGGAAQPAFYLPYSHKEDKLLLLRRRIEHNAGNLRGHGCTKAFPHATNCRGRAVRTAQPYGPNPFRKASYWDRREGQENAKRRKLNP